MKNTITLCGIALCLCAACNQGSPEMTHSSEHTTAQPSIGTATMESDGTIVLRLRANLEGGGIGESLLRYAPDSPHYEDVLRHLTGLEPGRSMPVPPWPDADE